MANLIERLTSADGEKIAIHAFLGALNEYKRGKITGAELQTAFNLDAAQTTQAQTLVGLLNAAPEKTEFMRVFKDLMYMGEFNLHSRYRDITFIQTRLQDEVTDQGGTLP